MHLLAVERGEEAVTPNSKLRNDAFLRLGVISDASQSSPARLVDWVLSVLVLQTTSL